MHLPCSSRSRLKASRSERVASTSSPFVGSSRMMFGGSWISARASAVFIRSPWLKPSVRRSSKGSISKVRARTSTRARATPSATPCRRAKYRMFSRAVSRV